MSPSSPSPISSSKLWRWKVLYVGQAAPFFPGTVATVWALLFKAREFRAGKARTVSSPIWHRICISVIAARSSAVHCQPARLEVGERTGSLGTSPPLCTQSICHRDVHIFSAAGFVKGTSPQSAVQAVECWKSPALLRAGKESPFHLFLGLWKHPLKCYCVYGKTSSGKVTVGPVPEDSFIF